MKKKITTVFLIIFISACGSSKEQLEADKARIKERITQAYNDVQSIPKAEACKNYKGYISLLDLERNSGTDYFSSVSQKKISYYKPRCEDEERYSHLTKTSADLLKAFENTEFFIDNDLYLDGSWNLNKGGINNHFKSNSRSLVFVSFTALDSGISHIGMEVLYPDDVERPIDLLRLFLPSNEGQKVLSYLNKNLKISRSAVADAPALMLSNGKLKAANVSWSYGSQTVNSYTISIDFESPITSLLKIIDEISREDKAYQLISDNIQKEIIKSLGENKEEAFLRSKYPYINNAERGFTPVKKEQVYLYYAGIETVTFWSKPGALNFGGKPVSKLRASRPIKANVIAHKSLPGDRNYFYIFESEDNQGWVGRPYVKKDKLGNEFYMSNPITGEKFQKSLKYSSKAIYKSLSRTPDRFVPEYESINWDPSIPPRYRQQGYNMYVDALKNGYDEVERLTRSYSQ